MVAACARALASRVTGSAVPVTRVASDVSTSASAVPPRRRAFCSARGNSVIPCAGKKGKQSSGTSAGLLSGVYPDSVEQCVQIIERAQSAADRWGVEVTGFLDPALVTDAAMCIARAADVTALAWGGHPRAERVRLVMGRPETLGEPWSDTKDGEDNGDDFGDDVVTMDGDTNENNKAPPDDSFRSLASNENGIVILLDISGNFVFDTADHRDFLGAILGTGIDRGKIGDIYVRGERGAFVMCAPEMGKFLETALTSVRTVPVKCIPVPLSKLKLPPPRRDEFNTIEASMRLDAIASAGFRMSRSKMTDLIGSGSVRLNWREGCKPKTLVTSGDVISLRGKGRVEVGAVGETKKGKFSVDVVRYL